jgi:hypothetical protein
VYLPLLQKNIRGWCCLHLHLLGAVSVSSVKFDERKILY